jgi:hypothetical protein
VLKLPAIIGSRLLFWTILKWNVHIINKIIHGGLEILNLSSCVQAQYLACCMYCSLVRYQVWTLEDKFHISASPCIIFYLTRLLKWYFGLIKIFITMPLRSNHIPEQNKANTVPNYVIWTNHWSSWLQWGRKNSQVNSKMVWNNQATCL